MTSSETHPHDHDPLDIVWSATDQPRVVAHYPCGGSTAFPVGGTSTARKAAADHLQMWQKTEPATDFVRVPTGPDSPGWDQAVEKVAAALSTHRYCGADWDENKRMEFCVCGWHGPRHDSHEAAAALAGLGEQP